MPNLQPHHRYGVLYLTLFVATVWLANWAIETYGIIPVGLGLSAPAGVLCAGAAFTLRDLTHDTLGRWAVIVAIVTGAALSWFVAPQFAAASGVAFLVSETCDFLAYSPLRKRGLILAVCVSNVVGVIADSTLFLWIAFGGLSLVPGLVLAKLYMTVVAVVALWILRCWSHRNPHTYAENEV